MRQIKVMLLYYIHSILKIHKELVAPRWALYIIIFTISKMQLKFEFIGLRRLRIVRLTNQNEESKDIHSDWSNDFKNL